MSEMTAEQLRGRHGVVDTVKIKADNAQGYAVINAHDFDKKVHERFVESAAGEAVETKAPRRSAKQP